MPIEIKELFIQLTVEAEAPSQSGNNAASGTSDEQSKQALIAECIEQVLQILHHKMER